MNCFLMRLCVSPKRYGIIWNNETIAIFGYRTFISHFKDIDSRIFDDKKGLCVDKSTEEIEWLKTTEEKNIREELLYYLAKSEKSEQQLKQWLAKRLVSKEKIKQYIEYALEKNSSTNSDLLSSFRNQKD